ncbi:DUF5686 and carboxypeptidase-like regulatory domain-containing protein [Marinilabilia salmonicolor]|uniref:DUF5686 and carboxypeptidase-like regulatory domain-containing protein n=1 Tax=Marinilabilia salmonicolor TaxID=989 RepID=UPI00046ADED6|nr:DUF5686 and carboxypeptidase-like regulatory domain-containing protein [Marinilabilia salmonicolor]
MYHLIKHGLFVIIILLGVAENCNSQIQGSLTDSETGSPIPFANIAYNKGKAGTITDLNGQFTINTVSVDTIQISSLGYHTTTFHISQIESPAHLQLQPKTIELQGVDVFPGENPALVIMQKVLDNSSENNPDLASNYSCIVYHKMTFSLDIPDTLSTPDSTEQRFIDINRSNHLLLMESLSEKAHKVPDKTSEKIISGRVSGFKDPALAILPGLIQPFGFYSPEIELMSIKHLNPISKSGLKNYLFLLEDTLIEKGDSLFYITYQPRRRSNIKPLTGSFHIHKKTWGIRYLKAKSALSTSPYIIDISQSYDRVEKQWFPSELKSNLIIKPGEGFNSLPYAMAGNAKSIVTAVDLNPDLSKKKFSNIILEDKMPRNTGNIRSLRYEPLTAKDSSTYHLLDSIGKANNLDNIIRLQKELIRGYIPAGKFLIDMKHLIGYNQFEGLKLGLGLWTGPDLTKNLSLGGYYTRSFKAEMNNYGGGVKWKPSQKSRTQIETTFNHDMHSTGAFNFYHGSVLQLDEQLQELSVSIKDREERFLASAQTSLGTLSGKAFFSWSDVTPVRTYSFMPDATSPEAPFETMETGIRLRWAPGEKLTSTAFGLLPEPTNGLKLWVNIIKGTEKQEESKNNFTKLESQLEKSFRTGPASRTTVRVSAGMIDGWNNPGNIYSYFGTFEPVSVEVPGLFATMAPNEFAADQFLMTTFNHRIALRQNHPGNFKPEINFMTKAGWGVIASDYPDTIDSFEKGFYESGLIFDNLLQVLFIKYGFGAHYRYGPYQKTDVLDNWSFRVSISFSL